MTLAVHGRALGPLQANAYVVVDQARGEAVVVDPGHPDPWLLAALRGLRVRMGFNRHPPLGGVQLQPTARYPLEAEVSIFTPPLGGVQPGSRWSSRTPSCSFNPHPASRRGAALVRHNPCRTRARGYLGADLGVALGEWLETGCTPHAPPLASLAVWRPRGSPAQAPPLWVRAPASS